jgi:hypothetical protein
VSTEKARARKIDKLPDAQPPCLKELLRVGEIVVLIDALGVQRHAATHQLHQQILQKGAGIVVVAEAEFTVAALTSVLSFRRPLTADERRLELRDVELLEAGLAIKNQRKKTHSKKNPKNPQKTPLKVFFCFF